MESNTFSLILAIISTVIGIFVAILMYRMQQKDSLGDIIIGQNKILNKQDSFDDVKTHIKDTQTEWLAVKEALVSVLNKVDYTEELKKSVSIQEMQYMMQDVKNNIELFKSTHELNNQRVLDHFNTIVSSEFSKIINDMRELFKNEIRPFIQSETHAQLLTNIIDNQIYESTRHLQQIQKNLSDITKKDLMEILDTRIITLLSKMDDQSQKLEQKYKLDNDKSSA